jgi:predicted HicB family RNase H-like nuclease
VNKTHKRTLEGIFADPVRPNIDWHDVESLLVALEAELEEGRGSRVRVELNDVVAVFHRPHPRKEASKPAGTCGVSSSPPASNRRSEVALKYKGYTGVVEFDEDSGSLHGRVIGLRDVITFQGESVAEVTQAFRDSVDDYLEFCARRNRDPEKPYSGQFVLRIDPRLHRTLSHAAEERGQSLTSLVEETLAAQFLGPTASHGRSVEGPDVGAQGRRGDASARPARKRAKGA